MTVKHVVTAVIGLMLTVAPTSGIRADEGRYITSGTSRARAIAMGGAYVAAQDGNGAGLYNPGAFFAEREAGGPRLRWMLNPVPFSVGLYDYRDRDRYWSVDDGLSAAEVLESASMTLKGLTLDTEYFDVGLCLWEEVLSDKTGVNGSGRMFSVEGLSRGTFHTAFANIRVAPTISIGLSGMLYRFRGDGKTTTSGGYSFGVLLAPAPRLHVGLSYMVLPDAATDARMVLEDIENETAIAGLSYHLDDRTVVAIDLRAVNKDDHATSRQIHTGLERRFAGRFAVRAGYYRKKDTQDDVISIGVGILPRWSGSDGSNSAVLSDIVSYTLVLEENGTRRRWHIVSLVCRF